MACWRMWFVLSANPQKSGDDQAHGTYRRWEDGCFIPSLEETNSLPSTVQGPKTRLRLGGGAPTAELGGAMDDHPGTTGQPSAHTGQLVLGAGKKN